MLCGQRCRINYMKSEIRVDIKQNLIPVSDELDKRCFFVAKTNQFVFAN
jgi:hypothetical protein